MNKTGSGITRRGFAAGTLGSGLILGSGRPLDGEKFASEGGLEGAQRRDWCASCASCSPGGCHIASRSGERVTIRLAEVVTGLASRA